MLTLAACALTLWTAVGCQKQITADGVRGDMSPGLNSIAESNQQRKNRHARTFDTNLRQIPDDIDTLLLLERPVRMSPYVIP